MTLFWSLIVATLVVAAADWWAVATDRRDIEYVLKPATMVVLIAAAVALADPVSGAARALFVVALVFSLAGDVFLMLGEKLFIAGLASFLVAHIFYVVGLTQFDLSIPVLVIGVVAVCVLAAVIGSRIVRGAGGVDVRLSGPVGAYIGVISLMVVFSAATLIPVAIAGAVLFYISDAVLGWNRFVAPLPNARIAIMSTYHLGQIGLVLALV